LLYVPIWLHNWYLLVIVAVWFAINPRIFPKPRRTENWMSRGVLGEHLWTQRWQWDFPMMLGIFAVPCFIGAVYTAYMRNADFVSETSKPGDKVTWCKRIPGGDYVYPVQATVLALTPKRVKIEADDDGDIVIRYVLPLAL